MSGRPQWNFGAFDKVRDMLLDMGHIPLSPADLDREIGFDPSQQSVTKEFLEKAMRRDLDAILSADAMIMLPGWGNSTGAKAEYALAKWRHLPVYQYPGMLRIKEDSLNGRTYHIKEALKPAGEGTTEPETSPFPSSSDDAVDPKKSIGDTKCPLQLLPPVALEHTAWVQGLGAKKYGPWNWRKTGVVRSTYMGAIMRHLFAIAKGEWLDPESGKPHVAHIAASCNILMDADAHNKLDHDQ